MQRTGYFIKMLLFAYSNLGDYKCKFDYLIHYVFLTQDNGEKRFECIFPHNYETKRNLNSILKSDILSTRKRYSI